MQHPTNLSTPLLQSLFDSGEINVEQLNELVRRLRSVIDDANTQEPVAKVTYNNVGISLEWMPSFVDLKSGEKLFASPIPAQQSPALETTELFSADQWWVSELNNATKNGTPDQQRAYCVVLNLLRQVKQSPAVAVPDLKQEYKLFCKWCDENQSLNLDPRLHTHSGQVGSGGYIDQKMANVAFKAWCARNGNPSPRITEQDAREIIEAYIENKIGVPVSEWLHPLLNKLNKLSGDQNGK